MGSRDSANEFMRKVNPKNISGSVKKALDLIDQLKKSEGNPTMPESVGAGNLASMLSQVAADFSSKSIYDDNAQHKKELEEQLAKLKALLAELKAMIPQSERVIEQEQEVQEQIDRIQKELDELNGQQ